MATAARGIASPSFFAGLKTGATTVKLTSATTVKLPDAATGRAQFGVATSA